MINFIIYEDNKKWQEKYHDAILKVIGKTNDKYHIVTIDKYTLETKSLINNLIGKKIFLLDLEVPGKSGLDLARDIRAGDDWLSPIIVITQHTQFKNEGFTSKILMLDFISKEDNVEEKIIDSLILALRIHEHHKSFNFIYENETYQIPHQDILYFEKDLNQNYTHIVTKKQKFKIKESIINIEKRLLTCPEFYKTHRSCIVNLANVTKISWEYNTIHFKEQQINLIARDRKRTLKEKMLKEDDYGFKYI